MDRKLRFLVLALFLLALPLWGQSYRAQTSAGSADGSSCANAIGTTTLAATAGSSYVLCGNWSPSAGSAALTLSSCTGTSGSPISITTDSASDLFSAPYFSTTGGAITATAACSYVTLNGGGATIQATANGTSLANHQNTYGIQFQNGCTNCRITGWTVEDIYVNAGSSSGATDTAGANTVGIGITVNGINSRIDHNTISQAKTGVQCAMDPNGDCSNLEIDHNTISDMDWGVNVGGGDASDTASGLLLHDNTITNWTNWQFPTSAFHQDGMILFNVGNSSAGLSASIYNNYIYGDLGVGSPTGFIYCADFTTCTIYNNLLVNTGHTIDGIMWLGQTTNNGKNMFVYNNTIVSNQNDIGITLTLTGHATIENNIVTGVNVGIHDYHTITSTVTTSNNNVWRTSGGAGTQMATNDSTFLSYATWQGDGYDAASSTASPNLSGGYLPLLGSSAIGLGANLTSLSIPTLDVDKAGNARPSSGAWTSGALNQGHAYTVKAAGGGDFTTIQACATAMAAGDTCTVYAGNYAENPTVSSGTVGNYKTINVNGSDVVTVQGFTIGSHVKIIGNCPELQGAVLTATCGFFLTNPSSPTTSGISVAGASTDSFVEFNAMYATGGVNFAQSSTHNTNIYFIGNTIAYPSTTNTGNNTGPAFVVHCDGCLFDSNDISHTSDGFTEIDGSYNVIRGNAFHDNLLSECSVGGHGGNCHIDFVASEPNVPGGGYQTNGNLIEGNSDWNCNSSPGCHMYLQQADTCSSDCSQTIVRFNQGAHVSTAGLENDNSWVGMYNYNNTEVDVGVGLGGTGGGGIADSCSNSATDCHYDNNLYYYLNSITDFNAIGVSGGTLTRAAGNLAYCTTSCSGLHGTSYGSGSWTGSGQTLANPLLVAPSTSGTALGDNHLQSGSPALNGGSYLTTVASGDSGSGTSLIVTDAGFFQANQGSITNVHNDCISITTVGNHVCITAINYATKTITLASSVSRSVGDHIWLYSDSTGAVRLTGTAPNMGAVGLSPACTLSFSPAAGTYTGTQNVTISQSNCPSGTTIYYRTDGLPATVIDTQYSAPVAVSSSQTLTALAVLNPTISDQPQTVSTQKKCNAIGSPITFPSGYSCNNGSGGVAGTVSNFNFIAGSSSQWLVTSTDTVDFDSSILHIHTPTATPDTSITHMSQRIVLQDTSNCTQTSSNFFKCVDVSESDMESCCDPTTHALWQMSTRFSTNASGTSCVSSGNNGCLEGDASSGNEVWNIPIDISKSHDLTVNTHWTLGDTGCGGAGCMVMDSIYLKEGSGAITQYNAPAFCDPSDTNCPNYPMTSQPTFANFTAGSQQQVYARNVSVAGTSPLTTTRSVSFLRVGVDEGNEATGSATYTIAPPAASPTFLPAVGSYSSAQRVTISSTTPSSTCYYTTDGSTPTTSSAVYQNPVYVALSQTLQSICAAPGFSNSGMTTGAYVIASSPLTGSLSTTSSAFNPSPFPAINRSSGVSWGDLCSTSSGCTYSGITWTVFDAWVSQSSAHSAQNWYTFSRPPQYANGTTDTTQPPTDLSTPVSCPNVDGAPTTTDCFFKSFVTALMRHTCGVTTAPGSPLTGTCSIKYFEGWNEINSGSGGVLPAAGGGWSGTAAQMAEMQNDAMAIIRLYDADALFGLGSTSAAGVGVQPNISGYYDVAMLDVLQALAAIPKFQVPDFITFHPYPSRTDVAPVPFPTTITSNSSSNCPGTMNVHCYVPVYQEVSQLRGTAALNNSSVKSWAQNLIVWGSEGAWGLTANLCGATCSPTAADTIFLRTAYAAEWLLALATQEPNQQQLWYAYNNQCRGPFYGTGATQSDCSSNPIIASGVAAWFTGWSQMMSWLTSATYLSSLSSTPVGGGGNIWTASLTVGGFPAQIAFCDKWYPSTCTMSTTFSLQQNLAGTTTVTGGAVALNQQPIFLSGSSPAAPTHVMAGKIAIGGAASHH